MSGGANASTPGVIFDLDGTLADTLDDIVDSINYVFSRIDQPPVSPEVVRPFIGIGLADLVRRTSGLDNTDQILGLVDKYRLVYTERMLRNTRLYAGIDSVLDTLTELNVPMCVLSNKPHEYTAPICDALLSRWQFVQVRGCSATDSRKPDPGVALELANQMEREPAKVYIIGDSSVDVATAHNAGMISVAATWGYGDRGELAAADPAVSVDEPVEFIELFREACRPQP